MSESRRRLDDLPTPAVGMLLFALFFVPLWLSRGRFLINWDSVQYALGVEAFDLAAHQPHPPGYIGYELLGRMVARLTGDVPAALTLVSVVGAALAPALLFVLACRMLPRRHALAAAVLFGCSPLLLHYGGVALTYAPEVALSLPFVILVHRAHAEGRLPDLLGAAVAFAVLGSVRPSAVLLLAPLWPLALLPYTRRVRVGATGLLVAACLVWAVPLMMASGGAVAYAREAMDLAGLAVARTAFMTASLTGVLQNVGILGVALVIGMHATLLLLAPARKAPGGSLGALSVGDRRFLLWWAAVPMLFFVFIHTGQPGYALLVLPAGYIWVGSALAQVLRGARGPIGDGPGRSAPSAAERAGAPRPARVAAGVLTTGIPPLSATSIGARQRRLRLWGLVGVLALSGAGTLMILPGLVYRISASEQAAAMQQRMGLRSPADLTGAKVGDVPAQSPLATALRQYSIAHNDAYWGHLVEFIGTYSDSGSVVLTAIGGPIASGSFRQLGYYLPEHQVYGVGWDRSDSFGHLFETRERESDYSVGGLNDASETLRLPDGVRTLIIPDADVAGLLDGESFVTERWDLQGGASVTVVHVPEGSVLELGNQGKRAHIRLQQAVAEVEPVDPPDSESGGAAAGPGTATGTSTRAGATEREEGARGSGAGGTSMGVPASAVGDELPGPGGP